MGQCGSGTAGSAGPQTIGKQQIRDRRHNYRKRLVRLSTPGRSL